VAAAVGATGLGSAQDLTEMTALEVVDDPIGNYPYRDWEDLYREEWDWDGKARSTHSVNCTGSCSWQVYTRNGQVWREEQAGDYPDSTSRSRIRTRGAVRRACFSDYVNADQRVTHPLRRTGERGEGKWGSGSPGTRRSPRSPRRSSTPSRTRSTTRSAASPRSRR